MNYTKLHKRIENLLEYETDDYFFKINLRKEISDKLLDYQYVHVLNLITALRTYQVVFDGSSTGTGKTYTAIATCKQLNLKPFIACPLSAIAVWRTVCKYFNIKPLTIVNYDMIKNGKEYDMETGNIQYSKCMTIKRENKQKYFWELPKNSVVIFDEVHRCKNPGTENGKLLMASRGGRFKVMLLSATASDKPESFHIFGYMLGFYNGLSKASAWIKGMLREDQSKITKMSVSSISKQIFPLRGSRMSISELGDKFPKNQMKAICYNLDENKRAEINRLTKSIVLNNNSEGKALVKLNKERQAVEKIKLSIFEELINDYLEEGFSVAVFVNFKDSLNSLAKVFKTDCVVHGDQTKEEREMCIMNFQENQSKLIICTLQSGGEGISLHDVHGGFQRVSLISPSYSAVHLKQALGRIWRAGSKSVAIQRVIFVANTLEEQICDNLKEKIDFMDKLTDDDLIGKKISNITLDE